MSQVMTSASDVPTQLDGLMDTDSHEMIPMHMWPEAFGEEVAALFTPLAGGLLSRGGRNSTVRPDILADDGPIDAALLWSQKGPDAPSAIDLHRRVEVMDAMGISRQLIFPTFALIGINIFYNPDAPAQFGFDAASVDRQAAGRAAIDAHNRWAAGITRSVEGDRVRPVGVVLTESVEEMIAGAEDAVRRGIPAVWIPNGTPPADTSPADPALDPFWSTLADADVPVVLHVGTQFSFMSPKWYANVPAFGYGPRDSVEFPIEPYRASTIHLSVEAMLGAMVLGGVFERHPRLRFGVIECGAQWVGPLAEKLDLWAGEFGKRLGDLTMRPSEYIDRNVRVTPFFFEPIGRYFERHPNLSDVYCFGSDYPHVEGGDDCKQRFLDEVAPLGSEVTEKFFVGNGEYLLPSR